MRLDPLDHRLGVLLGLEDNERPPFPSSGSSQYPAYINFLLSEDRPRRIPRRSGFHDRENHEHDEEQ